MITKWDIAANLAIADLDDNQLRTLPAAQQRELFGHNVFNRKRVAFDSDNQGTVTVVWWADPTCQDMQKLSYEDVANLANEKRRFRA